MRLNMFCLTLSLALAASLSAKDLDYLSYASLGELGKEKAAEKNIRQYWDGPSRPSKLFKNGHEVKRIGILGCTQKAFVHALKWHSSGSASKASGWSQASFSPGFLQPITDAFHDQIEASFKEQGFEIVPADEVAKAPSFSKGHPEESIGTAALSQAEWLVTAMRSADVTSMASDMASRTAWLGKLAQETGCQAFLVSNLSTTWEPVAKGERDKVKGSTLRLYISQAASLWVPESVYVAAAKANTGKYLKKTSNPFFVLRNKFIPEAMVFIPDAEGASPELRQKAWDEPILGTTRMLADMSARSARQQLAK